MDYIFQTERLGFRNWQHADIMEMAAINANPKVMEFFPATQTLEQTTSFVEKMQRMYAEKGFCYFAVDLLEEPQFIGFIGFGELHFEADFTPCIDIGWRLHPKVWGKGLAQEGAKKCQAYGFETLGFSKIMAVAPKINFKSEQVMIKIGMQKVGEFVHPLLVSNERLKHCVLYEKNKVEIKK